MIHSQKLLLAIKVPNDLHTSELDTGYKGLNLQLNYLENKRAVLHPR